ncbi:MAG: MBL fold metallo-hydrolase [Candidatus Nanoarchaeia archaeon]
MLATQILPTGGFVIQIQDYQIWVDPGPGSLFQAREQRLSASKTDIIFVSHAHLDHSNDLNALIDAMTIGGMRRKGILITTNSVVNGIKEQETYKEYPILLNHYRNLLKGVYIVTPGDKVIVGPLTFIATKVEHDCEGVGFKLESPVGTIGYTGDTGYFLELPSQFENCKVLIANVLRPGAEKWKTHLNSANAIELFKAAKPQLGIVTNFGMKMFKANPISEAREITRASGVTVLAAKSGMAVDLNTLFVH